MCLTQIYKRKPKKSGFGYKVFRKVNGKLLPAFRGEGEIPTEEWINADDYYPYKSLGKKAIPAEEGGKYSPGWHVYKKLRDAKRMYWASINVIRKVSYRGAHTWGRECGYCVIVAGEIYIHQKERK